MASNLARRLLGAAPIQPIDHLAAIDEWTRFRGQAPPLLTWPNDNAKLRKSDTAVYGLSLMPADASGVEVCTYRTRGCTAGCVAYAGKGELAQVQRGRTAKTLFLANQPEAFVTLLAWEIHKASLRHPDEQLAVRLNVFSDIPWERVIPWLFEWAHDVQFYDYTKWPHRTTDLDVPPNYDLTQSVTERWNESTTLMALEAGLRLAVVVPKEQADLPEWHGFPCVNGDAHDLRYLDPKPGLVLLKAKGRMRHGNNPMVHDLEATT